MFCYFIHILTCYCVGNLLILFGYLYFVGHGCSWMQDNSTYNDIVTNNKRNHGPLHSVFPPRSAESAEISSVKDLFEFICSGPLIDKLGFTSQTIADSIDKWLENGSHVCKLFQLNDLYLTTPQKARIYHYYIPVFLWCEKQISDHRSTFKDGDDIPPLVLIYLRKYEDS
ncbi:putative glycerate 3-kinase [Helianthus debilis subsp. tardiflorus]